MEIAAWWLASRLLVAAAAVVADRSGWPRNLAGGPLELLAAWDGGWYRLVAERGYFLVPFIQSDVAFFPLFPVLLTPARWLGIPLTLWGVLLANVLFLVALLALYRLGRVWLAEDVARRAAVYAAIFPFSFVFSMAYPESLGLAATSLAGLFAASGAWLACTAAVATATLARPQGALVLLPVAAAALRSAVERPPLRRAARWAAVLAAPLALVAFSLYLRRAVGDPLAWSTAQAEWGRGFSPLGPYVALREVYLAPRGLEDWLAPRHALWLVRDAAFLGVYLLLVLAAAVRSAVPRGWILFGAAVLLLPVLSGSFVSAARHGLLALPAYWGLALLVRSRSGDLAVKIVAPALLVANVLLLPGHHP